MRRSNRSRTTSSDPAAAGTRSEAVFSRLFLYSLLGVDAILIGLALLRDRGAISDPRASLGEERGFGEIAQYVKLVIAAVLLLWSAVRRTDFTPVLWGLLFFVLAVDDAFEGHERAGLRLSTLLSLPPIGGMRPNQLGELIVAGAIAAPFFTALAWTMRTASPEDRALSLALLWPLLLLGTFGVVVDAVHSLARSQWFSDALGYVEDGGELIAGTVLLWVTWRRTQRRSLA